MEEFDVLAFAANTYLDQANPASAHMPARIVKFHVDRDMNKGFVNILIKSHFKWGKRNHDHVEGKQESLS